VSTDGKKKKRWEYEGVCKKKRTPKKNSTTAHEVEKRGTAKTGSNWAYWYIFEKKNGNRSSRKRPWRNKGKREEANTLYQP